jgi:hypothetical protein
VLIFAFRGRHGFEMIPVERQLQSGLSATAEVVMMVIVKVMRGVVEGQKNDEKGSGVMDLSSF